MPLVSPTPMPARGASRSRGPQPPSAGAGAEDPLVRHELQDPLARGAGAAPLQRFIENKAGLKITRSQDLTEQEQSVGGLVNAADSDQKYLIASAADLAKRGRGEVAPMLTPHRHLIGERHNASRFTEALADWGWGADKMAEGFQTSAVVKDKLSDENQALQSVGMIANPYYQTKYLENLHPFVIQSLSMARFVLADIADKSGAMGRMADKVAKNVEVTDNKSSFTLGEPMLANSRALFLSQWEGGVLPHLGSYRSACATRLETPRGEGDTPSALLHDLATAMTGVWGKIDKNVAWLGKKHYDMFSSWADTSTALKLVDTNAQNFLTQVIDVFAAGLVSLTKAEIVGLGDDEVNKKVVDDGWDAAKGTDDGATAVHAIGPMREIFMADNINNRLTRPGIVQIGSKHVENLAGKITEGKYHASYAAFVAETKK